MNYKLNDLNLIVNIRLKKRNKKLYLRVVKPNIINITTPILLTDSKLIEIMNKNYEFIKKVLDKPNQTDDGKLHLFGVAYNYCVINSNKIDAYLDKDTIYIYAKADDERTIKLAVDLFYASELKKFVENNIENVKRAMNINFDINISYKNVKTYFGECFYKRKNVIFSTKLAKYDHIYILSVMYHELAHFYYHNHSEEFYNYLESLFTNYRMTQKTLRKIKFSDIY